MWMWRWLSVLLILATVPVAVTADDLVKLKAAVAERFAAYRYLSLDWKSTSKDGMKGTELCHWMVSPERERFDFFPFRGDASHATTFFDGRNTTHIWFQEAVDGASPLPKGGFVRIYKGPFSRSHTASNHAALILGVTCLEYGSPLVDFLNDFDPVPVEQVSVNGVSCLAWKVAFQDKAGSQFNGRLAVNESENWLPVLWETATTYKDDRTVIRTMRVQESIEVTDERTKNTIRIPSRGELLTRVQGGDELGNVPVELYNIKIGVQHPPESFRVAIPPGFRVTDETSGKAINPEYISGGVAAQKQRLAEIAESANSINRNVAVQKVDASIPKGSNWAIWSTVGAITLAGLSLYVRRLRE